MNNLIIKLHKNDSFSEYRFNLMQEYGCTDSEILLVNSLLQKKKFIFNKIKNIIKNLKQGGIDLASIDLEQRILDIKKLGKNSVTRESFHLRFGEKLGDELWQQRHEGLSKQISERNAGYFWLNGCSEEEKQKRWDEYLIKWKDSIKKNKDAGKYKGRNSLEHYQKIFGKREGKKRFNNRIEKMFNTMVRNRNFKQRVSNIANNFFNTLLQSLNKSIIQEYNYSDNETRLKIQNKRYFVDLYYKDNKGIKIIEFFGDYWHANPIKYKSSDIITRYGKNKTEAHVIWKEDEERISIIQSKHPVLVIWENELKNEAELLLKCKTFLQGENT